MPYAEAAHAKLYYEETGQGYPIVFVHEFAGDLRSWEPQVRYFSRRYRCITYNARGYPPSDVPSDVAHYGQDIATDDIAAVMRAVGVEKAHVVGLSMGGFACLHFGIRYPELASALVVAGCGYGAPKSGQAQFKAEADALAERFAANDMATISAGYAAGPFRVQYQNKDPRGWEEFASQFAEHDIDGAVMTLRGVQAGRPSIYDLEPQLRNIEVPMLIVTGDEDEPCLDVNLFMKRVIPSAGLYVLPRTGHTLNLEEPAAFNATVHEFFSAVERDRWGLRDPRSVTDTIMLANQDR